MPEETIKEKPGIVSKIKKWIIGTATVAVLGTGFYNVGDFNEQKGYPVYNKITKDTLWFSDSTKLTMFADSMMKTVVMQQGELGRYNLPQELFLNDEVVININVNKKFVGMFYYKVPKSAEPGKKIVGLAKFELGEFGK